MQSAAVLSRTHSCLITQHSVLSLHLLAQFKHLIWFNQHKALTLVISLNIPICP